MKKTFKAWIQAQFEHDELHDMVNFGVHNGFPGLIYYTETTALYRKYKDEIWDILYNEAEAIGVSIFEMLAQSSFGKGVSDADQFENYLIWIAAEKIAYDLISEE